MAISVASLASSFSDTDATSYNTASVSPTAGRAWIVWVMCTRDATDLNPATPAVTGAGLTWTEQASFVFPTGAGLRRKKLSLLLGTGTPSSGALTIDWTNTCANAGWSVQEITGSDTTNPIVQVVTNGITSGTATSGSVTLAAAADSNNRPISAWVHGAGEGSTAATSWTELSDSTLSAPATGFETQWRSDAFDTAAAASWATGSAWCGIAAEIRIPAAAGSHIAKLALSGVG